jgi:hypothetical protein
MADSLSVLKIELMQKVVPQLIDLLATAIAQEQPVHVVERELWEMLLNTGHQAVQAFFDKHGTGDLGEKITLPDGREAQRLEELHARRYVSIFGKFVLPRTVYGSREGQALELIPLDSRLQLPASDFSYVLQDWDQELAAGPDKGTAYIMEWLRPKSTLSLVPAVASFR